MAKDLKRSLTIAGHRTSLSLEPEFWDALKSAAARAGKSLTAVVEDIDRSRGERNLSSAVRVWLLAQATRR
jgi:predicted DNA-binding ribbon-helix-helix protein